MMYGEGATIAMVSCGWSIAHVLAFAAYNALCKNGGGMAEGQVELRTLDKARSFSRKACIQSLCIQLLTLIVVNLVNYLCHLHVVHHKALLIKP